MTKHLFNEEVLHSKTKWGTYAAGRATKNERRDMSTSTTDNQNRIPEPSITRFLFSDTRMAVVWLILRLWLGYEWLHAGWGKWVEGGWVGKNAGEGAVELCPGGDVPDHGEHPQVTGWYATSWRGGRPQRCALLLPRDPRRDTVGIALILGPSPHRCLLRCVYERQLPVCRDRWGQPAYGHSGHPARSGLAGSWLVGP